jgi:hypothetical protein
MRVVKGLISLGFALGCAVLGFASAPDWARVAALAVFAAFLLVSLGYFAGAYTRR